MEKKGYIRPDERPLVPWDQHRNCQYIYDLIRSYDHSGIYPLHMPGHKRNIKRFGNKLGFALDMTESEGMVNLHDPYGLLKKKQEATAREFGAAHSYFMINGSSGGILAGIRALTVRGDEIIFARNAHKSAYHAMEICDLVPHYVYPEVDEEFGILASVNPEKIEEALNQYSKSRMVFLTSPSFDGIMSDIRRIAEICHRHGVLLMVDEAHGAHLHYSDRLGEDSVACGADVVIQSLHKTLPSLTSTSLLHISDRVDAVEMSRQLSVFETTSPSHILLASIDECQSYLMEHGREEMEKLLNFLQGEFLDRLSDLHALRVFNPAKEAQDPAICFRSDPTKVIISTRRTELTGMNLKTELLKRGYELEMAYGDYALAITTIGDSREGLLGFADALLDIDRQLDRVPPIETAIFPRIPERVMSASDAMDSDGTAMPREAAVGHISREYIWAYPPGIPLIIPGERINADLLARFSQLEKTDIHLKSTYSMMPESIEVVKE